MKILSTFFLFSLIITCIFATLSFAYPSQKQVPVIGILISPMEECNPAPASVSAQNPIGCIESYYARWLEASAARIIPIPWNTTSTSQLQYLLDNVNGVLFPGGGLGMDTYGTYMWTIQYIVNYALTQNEQNNDPFFLWGTCFGFQLMARAVAMNQSVVTGGFTGMYPLMMALNFTSDQPSSRILGTSTTPPSILNYLQTQPTTLNWHHAGIDVNDWYTNSILTTKLKALSTNTEPSGEKSFISSYEGTTANIYATQFHPERPEFEFANPGIGHTPPTLAVSRYFANWAVARAKLNNHSFASAEESEKLILESHPLVYQSYGIETFYIIGDSSTASGLKEASVEEMKKRTEGRRKRMSYDL